MGTFDCFIGSLKCPVCGVVSEADDRTNIQTKIRDKPEGIYLSVGDRVEVNEDIANGANYETINLPQANGLQENYILTTWECPSCGTAWNWVHIIIENGIIKNILDVPKTSKTIIQTHFIDEECIWWLSEAVQNDEVYSNNLSIDSKRAKLIDYVNDIEIKASIMRADN
jgi:uncharacterized protein YlaI